MHLSDSEKGQVAGCCEQITEPFEFHTMQYFLTCWETISLSTLLHGAGSPELMNVVVAQVLPRNMFWMYEILTPSEEAFYK
jgi:hypothetical protein